MNTKTKPNSKKSAGKFGGVPVSGILYQSKQRQVTAMQIPDYNEDPSAELVDWLADNFTQDQYTSGPSGSLMIKQGDGYLTANPTQWLVMDENRNTTVFDDEVFGSLFTQLAGDA